MKIPRITVPLILSLTLIVTGCASTGGDSFSDGSPAGRPEGGPPSGSMAESFDTSFYKLVHDLDLTEEQGPVVRGILEDEQTARRALMEEARSSGDPRTGPSEEMRAQMEDIAFQTEEQLKLILTNEQMDVYREYVEEQRAALEARRESGGPRGGGRGGMRGGF